MSAKRRLLFNAVSLASVFASLWVVTGFLPVFPLFQGRVVIGRIPLFAAWWDLRWVEMGLHLLLAGIITGIVALVWRLGRRDWRFGLKTMLLLMTLVAAAVAIGVALSGAWAFRNGSQLP